jgi:hypothetical protein
MTKQRIRSTPNPSVGAAPIEQLAFHALARIVAQNPTAAA